MTAYDYALAELWARGEAWRVLLDSGKPDSTDGGQVGWVERFEAAPAHSSSVWKISRQRGKSFAAVFGAGEQYAQRTPGAIIRYLGQTGESAESILEPTLRQIFAMCPDRALLPEPWRSKNRLGNELRWDNGATFVWSGTDNETFRRQRGPRTHRLLLDESGFYPKLVDVEQALMPSLQTTGGKALYLCSPPLSALHPFELRYRGALAVGLSEHDTIHGNPRMTLADVEGLARREAARLGMTLEELYRSTYWRREYLSETVTEETRAAVPGWQGDTIAQSTAAVERPQHYDGYVSLDWGGYEGDPHAALFGWYDVASSCLVIEDELELRGVTLPMLSEAAKAKEKQLWGADRFDGTLFGASEWKDIPDFLRKAVSDRAPRQPYLRVSDHNEQLMGDLLVMYGYAILPADKKDKHLRMDAVDVLVRQGRLRVHPRCRRLLEQLGTTIWNQQRTEWERTDKDHGDLVDCLSYMVRHVRWNRDPRPPPPLDFWGQQPKQHELSKLAHGRTFSVRR